MIWWHYVTDDHIIKSAPFEMPVNKEDIGADGFTAAADVVCSVIDLSTAP